MINIQELPKAAIIGRTNVGKSTLFNRIIEESKAMTSELAGTTRDVIYGQPIWRGKTFMLVDTAGLDIEGKDELERNVLRQIQRAREEALILILVLDLQAGILPDDRKLITELLKGDKPYIIVANKADNKKARDNLNDKEWLNLPYKDIIPVSAKNGSGVGDLLDKIYSKFKKVGARLPNPKEQEIIKICLLGKPNVGKSSLLNKLLKKEVAVVSSTPHTTREPQDITIEYEGKNITLIDTAGIRKRARVERGLEKSGVRKSIFTLKKSDIALLVLDISKPLTSQDKHLSELIFESKKGLIIIANKSDIIKTMDDWYEKYIRYLQKEIPYLIDWAPVVFVSALSGEKVHKIYDLLLQVAENRKMKIPVKQIEAFVKKISKEHRPLKAKGVRHPKIFGIKQTGVEPPRFVLAIKKKTSIHESYLKFLSKKIRQEFELLGTPIIIETKQVKI